MGIKFYAHTPMSIPFGMRCKNPDGLLVTGIFGFEMLRIDNSLLALLANVVLADCHQNDDGRICR